MTRFHLDNKIAKRTRRTSEGGVYVSQKRAKNAKKQELESIADIMLNNLTKQINLKLGVLSI